MTVTLAAVNALPDTGCAVTPVKPAYWPSMLWVPLVNAPEATVAVQFGLPARVSVTQISLPPNCGLLVLPNAALADSNVPLLFSTNVPKFNGFVGV